MTVGDGIFWSTIVIVVAAAVYQVSARSKWRLLGKIVGILILVGAVVYAGVWGWVEYQDRPYVVEELAGARLGMKPVEVKVAKGKPTNTQTEPVVGEDSTYSMGWAFRNSEYADTMLIVKFFGDSVEDLKVGIICEFGGYNDLLGVSRGWSEARLVQELGKPSHTSISSDGLLKQMSYEQWRVSYRISRGAVAALCISASGKVAFADEYGKTESAVEFLDRPDDR